MTYWYKDNLKVRHSVMNSEKLENALLCVGFEIVSRMAASIDPLLCSVFSLLVIRF